MQMSWNESDEKHPGEKNWLWWGIYDTGWAHSFLSVSSNGEICPGRLGSVNKWRIAVEFKVQTGAYNCLGITLKFLLPMENC